MPAAARNPGINPAAKARGKLFRCPDGNNHHIGGHRRQNRLLKDFRLAQIAGTPQPEVQRLPPDGPADAITKFHDPLPGLNILINRHRIQGGRSFRSRGRRTIRRRNCRPVCGRVHGHKDFPARTDLGRSSTGIHRMGMLAAATSVAPPAPAGTAAPRSGTCAVWISISFPGCGAAGNRVSALCC